MILVILTTLRYIGDKKCVQDDASWSGGTFDSSRTRSESSSLLCEVSFRENIGDDYAWFEEGLRMRWSKGKGQGKQAPVASSRVYRLISDAGQ